jgi:hypothetical protein
MQCVAPTSKSGSKFLRNAVQLVSPKLKPARTGASKGSGRSRSCMTKKLEAVAPPAGWLRSDDHREC